MKESYILAIDGGSQSTKVMLFDGQGAVIAMASEPLKPMVLSPGGRVEHPDDDLWTSLINACQKLWAKCPIDRRQIRGVGLCTIRFCRALLKADGTLAQPVMSWMDLRVSSPYEHVNPDVAYVTTSSGYITHRLTGQFRDTAGNYQGQWPIDHNTWQWSADPGVWQIHSAVDKDMLFDLIMPGDTAGYVTEQASCATGIPSGLPVVATSNDKAVEGLGSGINGAGKCLVSLGTYITGMLAVKNRLEATESFWTNFACTPGNYLLESNGIRRGMWTVSWMIRILGSEFAEAAEKQGLSPEELIEREASRVPAGSHGLMTVLDFLAPSDQPYLKGSIIGLDGRHERGHMYRSILEAIALTMKTNIDAMTASGAAYDQLVLSGGGAKSRLLQQIFADVFNRPVTVNKVPDAVALGCAICVAVSMGIYGSFAEAVDRFVSADRSIEPNPDSYAIYEEMRGRVYNKIRTATEPLYKESFNLFG